MSMDPNDFLEACYNRLQGGFLKALESGSFFNVRGSIYMEFDAQEMMKTVLKRLDRERIYSMVVSKVEETVAGRVAAQVLHHIGSSVDTVMSNQETRKAVIAAVKIALDEEKKRCDACGQKHKN